MVRNWRATTLAGVCHKPQYGIVASADNAPIGPRFVRQTDILSGQVDWNSVPYCRATDEDMRKFSLREGDLLISRMGAGVGNAARVGHVSNAVFAGYLVRFRVDPEMADDRFIGYLLRSPQWSDFVYSVQGGAAQPTLNAQQMGGFGFLLPSLPEQRAIADVLGTLDNLIDTNTAIASDIEKFLTLIFEQLCFDIFDEESTLSDFVEVDPKLATPKTSLAPYIDMSMLPTSSALVAKPQQRKPAGGRKFQNGDTLVARITPCLENGKTAFIDCLDGEEIGIGSTEYICIRSSPTMPAMWTYFLARSPRFREYAVRNMNGTSGRQRCSAESIARYPIAIPTAESLTTFGKVADPMQKALRDLMDETEVVREARDALRPLLLAGKITPNSAAKLLEGV